LRKKGFTDRHEDRQNDGLRAVENDVAGRAGDGHEEREDALKGELQELDQFGHGGADAEL
jgi:hypothetical protein